MYGLPDTTWKKWKRNRRNTVIAFLIMGVSIGIDFLVVLSTLFLYLRDVLKTESPELWYGLIYASFFVSSSVFGVILGRWVDRTRKIRVYVNITLMVQILGCFLYIVPLHPVLLLIGRTLCGIGDSVAALAAGEVFRIFEKNDLTRVMALLSSVYAIGAMIGPPALAFLSANVDITLGPIKVNHLNFIGVFMIGFLLLQLVLVNLLIHNCSLQFDLKEHLKSSDQHPYETSEAHQFTGADENEDCTLYVEILPSSTPPLPIKTVLKTILTHKDTALVLVSTLVLMYGLLSATTLFPLLVTVTLQWDVKHLSIIYSASGAFEIIHLLVVAKYIKSNSSNYYMVLLNIASQIVNCCLLICIKVIPRHFTRDVVFVVIFVVTMTLGYSFDDIMIKVIFANMIPSEIQSFSEGFRSGVSRVAVVVASLTVAVMMPWCHLWSCGMLVLYLALLSAFVVHRRRMMNPGEVMFSTGKTLSHK